MKIFNEESLRSSIVEVWGAYGAHIEVFDMILTRMKEAEAKNKSSDNAWNEAQSILENRDKSLGTKIAYLKTKFNLTKL